MLVKRSRTRAGDGMAKVMDLGSSKCALLQVDGEAIEAADVKDLAEVKLMRLQGVRKHQNIIKIDETEREITKDLVHHPLKNLGGFLEAKGEAEVLKKAKGSNDVGDWECRPLEDWYETCVYFVPIEIVNLHVNCKSSV